MRLRSAILRSSRNSCSSCIRVSTLLQSSANEVSLSQPGSYASDAMWMELELRVRAWEAAQRSTGVEVDLVG